MWNTTVCPQRQQSPKLYFSFNAKVTRSLTLVSFERASLVSMHAKYEVLSLTVQKLQRRLKLTTDRQTNKQTGQKQYAPDHSIRAIKIRHSYFDVRGKLLAQAFVSYEGWGSWFVCWLVGYCLKSYSAICQRYNDGTTPSSTCCRVQMLWVSMVLWIAILTLKRIRTPESVLPLAVHPIMACQQYVQNRQPLDHESVVPRRAKEGEGMLHALRHFT